MVQLEQEPQLNFEEITLTDHAWKRVQERLNRKYNNKHHATTHIRSELKRAKFVGRVHDTDGNPAYLYTIGKNIGVYVSIDGKTIRTVIKEEAVNCIVYNPLKEKVSRLYELELNKLKRKEQSVCKRHTVQKLRLNMELAAIEYKLHTSRSNSIKCKCTEKKNQLQDYIRQMDDELLQIRNSIKQISKSLVIFS